jgi:glycosyltransferase involved in cell wall biosynthesis
MAYGIPVVSSNLLSIQPFVAEGQNGYLVAADDPSAHASAIVELLSCPERALAMGKQGQGLARSCYNWDEMENRLLAFYRDLLS